MYHENTRTGMSLMYSDRRSPLDAPGAPVYSRILRLLVRSATGLLFLLAPAAARAEHTIAGVGLVHSHVRGHLRTMLAGKAARLAGVAGSIPEPAAEARQRGAPPHLFHADYRELLDAVKPEIVGAFVENNRHLEIARECARRRIHIMFEKPLASSHREALAIRDLAR
jgi:predicted dehydrogenase